MKRIPDANFRRKGSAMTPNELGQYFEIVMNGLSTLFFLIILLAGSLASLENALTKPVAKHY
jgi:hypothetical protein